MNITFFLNIIIRIFIFLQGYEISNTSSNSVCIDRKYYKTVLFLSTNCNVKESLKSYVYKKDRKIFKQSDLLLFRVSREYPWISPKIFSEKKCLNTDLYNRVKLNSPIEDIEKLSTSDTSDIVLHFYPIIGNTVLCQFVRYSSPSMPYILNTINGRFVNILICFDDDDNIIDYLIVTNTKG